MTALGGDGASRRRTAEHGRPKVRLKWDRTSGTSCAVAWHAESEWLLVPLGRLGNPYARRWRQEIGKNKCLISRPSAINSQMRDASDMELLRDYDRQGSETAFAALVQRHVNLVYSVALRHVGIAAHAEEITQAVFIILSRKSASLRPDTIFEGWLHETTRLTALSFLRGERRRQFREQEAYMQSTLQQTNDVSTYLDKAAKKTTKRKN